ncbi:MAG: glycerol-3-phosphate 1-O-acyltransferase PlsY [Clostridia bacterium]|nr:glycerol-3-phosphate 1-O-acyltransferase PlsY [Clostridia bacterium]
MFDIFAKYWWQFCIVAVLSYCIGSVNFAVIFSNLIKKKDVRKCGSGNPGTTNMFRVFGLRMGVLTFVCDALKGVVCCLPTYYLLKLVGDEVAMQAEYFAGLFVILGHVFPALHRFRGGKGVATSIGVMFCVQPILMLCCVLPMLVVVLLTDRMSVMSLLYSVFMIVWCWTMLLPSIGLFCCVALTVMFALVIFAHRHNIVRLCTGKENSMGIRRALRGKGDHHLQELKEREEKKNAVNAENDKKE